MRPGPGPEVQMERTIFRCLHLEPALAFELFSTLPCHEKRRRLAPLIAHAWKFQDINVAWNSVSRSTLSAAEKQMMFNELWS
ncbi:hypothetical protein BH11VER1_BH11VER1_09100 [soil metagenome]